MLNKTENKTGTKFQRLRWNSIKYTEDNVHFSKFYRAVQADRWPCPCPK